MPRLGDVQAGAMRAGTGFFAGLVVVSGALGWSAPVDANSTTWAVSAPGNWFDAANWTGGVPAPGDTAIVGRDGAIAQIAGSATLDTLNIYTDASYHMEYYDPPTSTPSTVDIRSGGSLTANQITIGTGFGGPLNTYTKLRIDAGGNLNSNAAIYVLSDGMLELNGQNLTLENLNAATGIVSTGGKIVIDNATLTLDPTGSTSIYGSISGNGALIKDGPGTVVLRGYASTYSGGTTINDGTLELFVGGTLAAGSNLKMTGGTFQMLNGFAGQTLGDLSGTGGVISAGCVCTLVVGTNNSTSFAGNFVNAGTIIKQGSGTLTLTGSADPNSAFIVAAGALQIGNGATSGSFDAGSVGGGPTASGTLDFNRSDTVAYAGLLYGGISLQQLGSGTVILTNQNSYSGATTINSGVLQIGNGGTSGSLGGGSVVDEGVLAFNRSDGITVSNTISGSGSLIQNGVGTVTLTAANTYTGPTTINAGTVVLIGSNAASTLVSVNSGASLAGTGTAGATQVNSGGTIAPGNSNVGTLNFDGNLEFASGSTYAADVAPSASDRIVVSGSATLAGTLVARSGGGTYSAGQQIDLLSAAGGYTGSFDSLDLVGDFDNLKPRLLYTGDDVYLVLDIFKLSPSLPADSTSNERTVAQAIDTAVSNGGHLPASFEDALANLSGTGLQTATAELAGDMAADLSYVGNAAFTSFFQTVFSQLDSSQGDESTPSEATESNAASIKPAQVSSLSVNSARAWFSVIGSHDNLDSTPPAGGHGLDTNAAGLVGGIDARMEGGLLIGVTAAFSREKFKVGDDFGRGDASTIEAGLYGQQSFQDFYVAGVLGYGSHSVSTRRTLNVAGTDELAGKFEANSFGGSIEAGVPVHLDDLLAVPYAAIGYQVFDAPAYAETAKIGSPLFALSHGADSTPRTHTEVGSRLRRSWSYSDKVVSLAASVSWVHAFETVQAANASFQAIPGSTFTVLGDRLDADTARLGVTAGINLPQGYIVCAHVDGQFGSRQSAEVASLEITHAW